MKKQKLSDNEKLALQYMKMFREADQNAGKNPFPIHVALFVFCVILVVAHFLFPV